MSRFSDHVQRVMRSAGQKPKMGEQTYKFRGYLASNLAAGHSHEPYLLPVIRDVLAKHPGAFIDVGANNGQTLFKVLELDPHRAYVGFEPQVVCCAHLLTFIQENQLTNCTLVPCALGEATSILTLFGSTLDDEGLHTPPSGYSSQAAVRNPCDQRR